MLDILALAQQCAPVVHPQTIAAVARVESGLNPFAIGIVGGRLERQPVNKDEAVATARALEMGGFNFSLGLGQVNRHNLSKYGLNYETAFEPCSNLRAASLILKECYDRATGQKLNSQAALQAAFSCYYSGNFSTGFRSDFPGQPSYVQKVLKSSGLVNPIRVIAAPKQRLASKPKSEDAFNVFGTSDDSVLVFR